MNSISLLAGPDRASGAEPMRDHLVRLGPMPPSGPVVVDLLERSGLRGCGGAAFPAATKWRAVAAQPDAAPVILVNGAEGEPLSGKDRLLMEIRPHLVLDGAALAAETLGAQEVVLYIGASHSVASEAMARALRERPESERRRTRMVSAPAHYVSGEESAAVHYVNDGVALPTTVPPRPFERGVAGRPTLVQNVETLAHAAMIVRFGAEWFRGLAHDGSVGTALLTISRAGAVQTVVEVPQGLALGDVVGAVCGTSSPPSAILLGGYFGAWVAAGSVPDLPIDPAMLRARGYTLGCGVLAMLPAARCGVVETSRILNYLAGQIARQCGPCVFGLRSIADALHRIAARSSGDDELHRVQRWAGQLAGRGACRHPDGAASLLHSGLAVFADEFALHQQQRRCSVGTITAEAA